MYSFFSYFIVYDEWKLWRKPAQYDISLFFQYLTKVITVTVVGEDTKYKVVLGPLFQRTLFLIRGTLAHGIRWIAVNNQLFRFRSRPLVFWSFRYVTTKYLLVHTQVPTSSKTSRRTKHCSVNATFTFFRYRKRYLLKTRRVSFLVSVCASRWRQMSIRNNVEYVIKFVSFDKSGSSEKAQRLIRTIHVRNNVRWIDI